MKQCKYLFGDIVVVDTNQIGVIVKCWYSTRRDGYYYEVYVRSYNAIKEFDESEIERYRVRHKHLDKREMEWQGDV